MIWLILPAFNEARNLPRLLTGLESTLGPPRTAYRIVLVDDGSSDSTPEIARAWERRVPLQVVRHGRNRGLARAVESGIAWVLPRAGAGDVIVTMDADNTHPPHLILVMGDAIQDGADVVIASRYLPGGAEEGVPLTRRILSRAISALLRLRFGIPGLRDYSCGYRAYRAGLLQAAARRYGGRLITAQGFTVMAELLIKLAPFRPRIVEVPLHLRYDQKRGASKMQLLRTVVEYLALLASRPSDPSPEGTPR